MTAIAPTITPPVPIVKIGFSAEADTIGHGVREDLVAGLIQHAGAEPFVGGVPLPGCTSLPLGDVMLNAAGGQQRER